MVQVFTERKFQKCLTKFDFISINFSVTFDLNLLRKRPTVRGSNFRQVFSSSQTALPPKEN